jgi:hypothetical protein
MYKKMQEQKEVWKDVKDLECYYVISNLGNIKRKDGTSHLKPKNLKMLTDKDGYHKVNLKVKQKTNSKIVHRLLAEAFIPNPLNKPQINHKNGKKDDNRLENLEWCNLRENRQHAYNTGLQNGLSRRGSKNNFVKLTKHDVLNIRSLYDKKNGVTMNVLSKKFNVTEGCIQSILSKKTWAWI